MKTKKSPKTRSLRSIHRSIPRSQAALALILIGLGPVISHAQESSSTSPEMLAAKTRSTVASMDASEHKAELEIIDRQIDMIEDDIDRAPEGPERDAARRRPDALKDRRSELRKDYVASKYEALKADVRTEYEKAAAWTKDKYQDVKEGISGPKPNAPARLDAASNANANAALAGIAVYQMHPSPENKADVKQALDALDKEIDRLSDRADELPKGEQRTQLERRINALEDRQDELEHNFTKARWDALVADVKSEWNELIH